MDMTKISERENFIRMITRRSPDFVPYQPYLLQMLVPSAILDRPAGHTEGYDWFGVQWSEDQKKLVPTANQKPILDDICDWEEKIEWPDLEQIDWEACAKKDVPKKDPSKILCAMMLSGPFERLHDLMGFEDALCALMTDPEECEAFFSRLCDFKIQQLSYLKEYYDVDLVHFQDDWGSQKDLFFNPEIWHTMIKPHVKRVVDAAHDLGIYFDMHSCGNIERIVDDIIGMDIDVLDPLQPVNDLASWARKYSGKVVFMGGIDAQNVVDRPGVTRQEIRDEVRKVIDMFAKDGYIIPFCVGLTPKVVDSLEEIFIYGRTFYSDKYQDDVQAFIADLENKKE